MTRRLATPRLAAMMSVAATAAAVLVPASAEAQANCQWYAATSLKQQQQNEKLRCGFAGPEWSTDLARHNAWCASVPPDVWKASAQRRDQMIANCARKAR